MDGWSIAQLKQTVMHLNEVQRYVSTLDVHFYLNLACSQFQFLYYEPVAIALIPVKKK